MDLQSAHAQKARATRQKRIDPMQKNIEVIA
jgi:hypothetical protein